MLVRSWKSEQASSLLRLAVKRLFLKLWSLLWGLQLLAMKGLFAGCLVIKGQLAKFSVSKLKVYLLFSLISLVRCAFYPVLKLFGEI